MKKRRQDEMPAWAWLLLALGLGAWFLEETAAQIGDSLADELREEMDETKRAAYDAILGTWESYYMPPLRVAKEAANAFAAVLMAPATSTQTAWDFWRMRFDPDGELPNSLSHSEE